MTRLAGLFRSRSDLTSLKRLERDGVRSVNVLDLGRLETLVGEAMETAIREAIAAGGSAEFAAGGAQVEFLRRLGLGARLADHGDQLASERAQLAGQVETLRGVLDQTRQDLAARQRRERATVEARLRTALDTLLDQAFSAFSAAAAQAPDVERAILARQPALRAALLGLLQDALQAGALAARAVDGAAPDDSSAEIDRLERRVRKLNAQLLETQELLERSRAGQLEAEGGIASIHRTAQGLAPGSAGAESKKALLRSIFEHNLELRRTLTEPPAPSAPSPGARTP